MKNATNKFLQIGVEANKLRADHRITRMLNLCCSYTFIGAMILILTPYLQSRNIVDARYFGLCIYVGMSYGIILIANALNAPKFGRLLFGFVTPLWPVVTLLIVGQQFAQVCAASVTTIMQYFIFRNHKETRIIAVSYNLVLVGTTIIYITYNQPLLPEFPDYNFDDLAVYLLSMTWVFISFDVYQKDNRRLFRSVQNKNKQLKIKTTELEQFAYITSHDLKNPIRNILNFSSLLKNEKLTQLDDDGQKFVGFINDSSLRMNRLVEDMLQHSIIGTSGDRKTVDLNEVLQGIKVDLKTLIAKKNAQLHFTLMPNVFGLQTELRSLFLNLITNALKYSDPSRNPKIQIAVVSESKNFTFVVKDNGIGFDMKYLDKIFTAFQRLDQNIHKEGTGIGLANCRKIVEMHGGKIWAESVEGSGSTFYFTLPKKM